MTETPTAEQSPAAGRRRFSSRPSPSSPPLPAGAGERFAGNRDPKPVRFDTPARGRYVKF